MSIIYRLLGIVARVNENLSRKSINFIALNWAIMVGLGFLLATGMSETRDALVNGDKPRQVTLTEVLDHRNLERNFVSVAGVLFPDGSLQKTVKHRNSQQETVTGTYVPLLELATKHGIFVERAGQPTSGPSRRSAVTGMLKPIDSMLKNKLMETGGKLGPVPFDTDYMLVEGATPGNGWVWGVLTVVSLALFVLFLLTWFLRYVVFERTRSLPPSRAQASAEGAGIDLRVSGKFTLDGKAQKRFLNVPATITKLETGELALLSNVDASSKFMGVTTTKRAGLWSIIVPTENLQSAELGLHYVGLAVRPAFRITCRQANSGKTERPILSFSNGAEREKFAVLLNERSGANLPTC